MVIDTSAVLCLLFDEPEAKSFATAIEEDSIRLISAASVLEATIAVRRRRGQPSGDDIDRLLRRWPVDIVPIHLEQLYWARYAFETYGRGHHPARLNFGDCFSYALAKAMSEPILFKGDDFSHTDLEIVPVARSSFGEPQ